MSYGPHGWFEKIHLLQYRTDWLCNKLTKKGIAFFRQPFSNQVSIESDFISPERNSMIKRIKDLSAAAVLFSAVTSLIVGALIFLPKLIDKF